MSHPSQDSPSLHHPSQDRRDLPKKPQYTGTMEQGDHQGLSQAYPGSQDD